MDAARERELVAARTRRAAAEAPLLAELRAVGIDVPSCVFLDWNDQPYPQALDILLDHFRHNPDLDDSGRGFLAQKLGVPPMRERWDELVQLYLDTPSSEAKEGLAVALSQLATKAQYDQLHDFIHDPTLGQSRALFVRRYARLGRDAARADIAPLADDPDIGKEVTAVLKRRSPNQ